jgi:hypothetical protein
VDLVVGQRYMVLVDGVPACAVVVVMGMRVHDCEQHRNRHGTRDACGNGFSRSPQCLVELSAHEQRQRFGTRCKGSFLSSSPHERERYKVARGLASLKEQKRNEGATHHFLSWILSHFVPVCAATSFFRSPIVSSSLHGQESKGVKGRWGCQRDVHKGKLAECFLVCEVMHALLTLL